MMPGPWQFDWIHVNECISIYYRFRHEQTSDGMEKPYAEALAYMQKLTLPGGPVHTEYRALLHDPDDTREIPASRSIHPMQVMDYVQQYFSDK